MNRKQRVHKSFRVTDNNGFSLLELLVSILILVLIMVPLMHNFIRSAQINKQAQTLQDYSMISSNLVEDINSMPLNKVLAKYGSDGLKKVGTDYVEQDYTATDLDLDTYYFGLTKAASDGTQYKVLVTVNADDYKNAVTLDGSNDYKMPDIATVNDELNGMFFSDIFFNNATNSPVISSDGLDKLNQDIVTSRTMGTPLNYQSLDRIVFNYFSTLANDYANAQFKANSSVYSGYLAEKQAYEAAIINGVSPPLLGTEPTRFSDPAYASLNWCMTDNLLKWITRTTDINISGTTATTITYKITYQCSWPSGIELPDTKTYVIQTKKYGVSIKNVYLYYHPSIFQQYNLQYVRPVTGVSHQDGIEFTNTGSNNINIYIVNLSGGMTAYVDSTRDGTVPGSTSCNQLDTSRITYTNNITPWVPSVIIYKNSMNLNISTNLNDIIEYISGSLVAADAQDINQGKIIALSPENRIYSVNVQIFEDTHTDPYNIEKLLYDLNTNREN